MAIQRSEGFVYCAVCRTKSPTGAARCVNCGFPFSGEAMAANEDGSPNQAAERYELIKADSEILPGRPGCVTLYILALLLGMVGVGVVLATPNISRNLYGILGGALPTDAYYVLGGAAVIITISLIGLFFLKNWSRWVQIGLLGVALIAQIPLLIWGFRNPRLITNWNTLGLVFGSAIILLITLRWFWTNGKRFS